MDDKTRTQIMKISIDLHSKGHDKKNIINVINQLYPTIETKNLKFVVESAIGMLVSFDIAVDKAGGSNWPTNKLLEMTFLDLISNLATNGIRFVFEK